MTDDIVPIWKRVNPGWQVVDLGLRVPVVTQFDEESCGPAPGEMLLADRGLTFSQREIAEWTPLPASAHYLAATLSRLSGLDWRGGAIRLSGAPPGQLVELLCEVSGSWGALLQPGGLNRIGHWVVVDGLSRKGEVLVRDPVGAAYGIPVGDFSAVWRYTMHVREVRS